jgi:hypothetical protein
VSSLQQSVNVLLCIPRTPLEILIANAGMQRWLSEEGEHAMRLLTRHETGFQPRLIGAIQEILEAEAAAPSEHRGRGAHLNGR